MIRVRAKEGRKEIIEKSDNHKILSVFKQDWWVWAVYALSIVVLVVFAFVPRGWSIISTDNMTFNYGSITLLRPWVTRSISLSAIFCFIALLITIRSILCRKHTSLKIFYVILILLFLISPIYRFNPQAWRIYDKAIGPDDNSYYYMSWSFMMGGVSALSRLESRTLFKETFIVLQIKSKDSGVGQIMIRPAEFPRDNHLRLYVSSSVYIVGMVANNCKLAYDFNGKRSFGEDNIYDISPFVLIDSNTPMNQNDVRDLTLRVKDVRSSVNKGIYKSTLEKSLDHPNESVRKLAQQLLDILSEEKVVEPDRL